MSEPSNDSPRLEEAYCSECGENLVLVPVDDLDGFYICEECADA